MEIVIAECSAILLWPFSEAAEDSRCNGCPIKSVRVRETLNEKYNHGV